MAGQKRLGMGLNSLLSKGKENKEENQLPKIEVHFNQQPPIQNQAVQSVVPTQVQVVTPAVETTDIADNNGVRVSHISLTQLKDSMYQPRKYFDAEALSELAKSISEHGLLEPLIVKQSEEDPLIYEILCGERRFRASKLAGLETVPCIIRPDITTNAYAIALIENIQREDLNPLEQAEAFDLMLKECNMTQEELARTLGKSRSAVANLLRLNSLTDYVKLALRSNQIDLGHAKVLLSLSGDMQIKACEYVIKKEYSVRQTEMLVKSLKAEEQSEENTDENTEDKSKEIPTKFLMIEDKLKTKLPNNKVKFTFSSENKGKLTLSFKSEDEFNEIMKLLNLE